MTPGHRTARIRVKTSRSARKQAPWAEVVVRVAPDLYVAYESLDPEPSPASAWSEGGMKWSDLTPAQLLAILEALLKKGTL